MATQQHLQFILTDRYWNVIYLFNELTLHACIKAVKKMDAIIYSYNYISLHFLFIDSFVETVSTITWSYQWNWICSTWQWTLEKQFETVTTWIGQLCWNVCANYQQVNTHITIQYKTVLVISSRCFSSDIYVETNKKVSMLPVGNGMISFQTFTKLQYRHFAGSLYCDMRRAFIYNSTMLAARGSTNQRRFAQNII